MGVPKKMRESHGGTYFIWPFRWRGFFGGSRMSSKMVSLHFPEKNHEGHVNRTVAIKNMLERNKINSDR